MRFSAQWALVALLIVAPCPAGAEGKKPAPSSGGQEVVIDAIVAAVDDKPITLSELNARLPHARRVSLREAAKDEEAIKTLDGMILEKLVELEASAKKVSISDAEVEEYINEVAARNSLSRPEFEAELRREGQSIDGYRKQVKFDILRTKLATSLMQGGTTVSDAEVDEYVASHPELNHSGTTLKLSIISISAQGRTAEQVQTKSAEVVAALDAGDPFADVARRFSDGPNSSDGGSLGLVVEQDLSPEILEAVGPLEEGSHTRPIANERGVQFFLVEQRFSAIDDDDNEEREKAIRQLVKADLQKQKSRDRMSSFFINDLFKNHSVDKKL